MEFVHPEILWALSSLAIPIAVHLLHFRRFRKIAFSQVAFLNEVKKETKAMQKIRHWIILLLRLLALSAIILAFAQPFFPPEGSAGDENDTIAGHAISIYVDNSFSMQAIGEDGQLLQSAKNKAAVVVEQFEATDRFQIVSNEFSGRDQIFLTQKQAMERLAEIKTSPIVRPVEAIMKRMGAQLEKEPLRKRVGYLFSDLQESTHRFTAESTAADTNAQWHFIPEFASTSPNIWIDSIWFEEPLQIAGRPASLRIRLQHNARQPVEGIPMHLNIQGERVGAGTFHLLPGLPTDTALRFTHGLAGLHRGRITIEDAPIQFDDDLYFGYDVRDEIHILHITDDANSEASQSIERVFQSADNLYRLRTVTTWSPRELEGEHLVLVSGVSSPSSGLIQTLASFVDRGGSVCYMPDRQSSDPQFFQAFDGRSTGSWISVSDRVSTLQTSHPFFTGVFDSQPERLNLPTISELWHRETSAREEVLATTLLGHSFFSRLPHGKGTVYFLATSPEPSCSNVTRHALWVPLLLRMAEQSKATPVMWGIIGQKSPINVAAEPDDIESVSLSGPIATAPTIDQTISNEPNWLPETRVIQGRTSIQIGNLNLDPGHYRVNFGARNIALFGINQNRIESDHRAFSVLDFQAQWTEWNWSHVDVVQASAAALSDAINQLEKGNPVWFLFMYIALFALFVESFLLRSWKRSS
ncbi:MAG: BatA domain-containing protein [Flavobacteriales bacterium]|nr:BatA domain-containing protein [Flavobacteriales bacterium]